MYAILSKVCSFYDTMITREKFSEASTGDVRRGGAGRDARVARAVDCTPVAPAAVHPRSYLLICCAPNAKVASRSRHLYAARLTFPARKQNYVTPLLGSTRSQCVLNKISLQFMCFKHLKLVP